MPAVMQHLAVLEERGIVRSEKVGRVRPVGSELAGNWASERRAMCERSLDRLGQFLADQQVH